MASPAKTEMNEERTHPAANDNNDVRRQLDGILKADGVVLPVPVQSALNDAFAENDFLSSAEDSVNIYFREDKDLFEDDVSEGTVVYVMLDSDKSSGDIVSRYTYYGKIAGEKTSTEDIRLFRKPATAEDDPIPVTTIASVSPAQSNAIDNPNDFCIAVMVEEMFENGQYTQTPRLYLYVPQDRPKTEDAEDASNADNKKYVDKHSEKRDNTDAAAPNTDILSAIDGLNGKQQ